MWYDPIVGIIIFGILTLVFGYISGYILKHFNHSKIPAECVRWNDNHIMEKSLFLTGAMIWVASYMYAKYLM